MCHHSAPAAMLTPHGLQWSPALTTPSKLQCVYCKLHFKLSTLWFLPLTTCTLFLEQGTSLLGSLDLSQTLSPFLGAQAVLGKGNTIAAQRTQLRCGQRQEVLCYEAAMGAASALIL